MQKKSVNWLADWGPVYWNVFLYRQTMNILRPGGRRDLFAWIADEIGALSVLELCPGEGTFRDRIPNNAYISIEKNPMFVKHLRRKKIPVIDGNVMETPWPKMDCLLMIDSLYHFIDHLDPLMERAKKSHFQKVIICESIRSYSLNPNGWLSKFAVWATRVDGHRYPKRFSETLLQSLYSEHGFQTIKKLPPYLIGVRNPR